MSQPEAVAAPERHFTGLDLMPAQTAVLDRNGVIQYVNAAWDRFAEANGYRGPGFVGQHYLGICEAARGAERDDGRAFAAGLRDVLSGAADQFTLTYPCHAPGRERWYKAIVGRHGNHAVVCHMDITAEYTSAARMTDPVWNRATLHELKTPLNSIQGFAELASSQIHEGRGAVDVGDCLTTIRQSASQMLKVINDVLRNAGQDATRDEDVPLAPILREVRERHRGAAAAAGITVETSVDGELWLRADPDRLTTILDNLISNAVKYSEADGAVAIHASRNGGGGIEIAVTDSGIGIAEADLASIFRPYVRVAAQAGVAGREGSGLGLAVARNLMQMHGGEIRAESTPGAGSRFTLVFPAWRTVPGNDNGSYRH